MFFRTFLVGLTLAALAIATPATACPGHDRQAQSCIPGYAWDDEAATCVPEVTG
ncbi:hypothetical protein [Aliiroseovarius sp.]|uniref:hypothetical protein n=1 Tax=Aliiroseovarius sp. TaxID=1872442 RepID=UPI002611710E|nr:hypothetical protein [Aliiroseovarius sp.]